MKNLKNRIEVLEEQLEKKEQKRQQEIKHRKVVEEAKQISVEKLPYSYSALKQFIDPETMNVHYNKHYKGYVDKLNAALDEKEYGDLSLEEIIKTIERFNKFIRKWVLKLRLIARRFRASNGLREQIKHDSVVCIARQNKACRL